MPLLLCHSTVMIEKICLYLLGPWATWPSGWHPRLRCRGWNRVIFKVPSNLNCSVILWFCSVKSVTQVSCPGLFSQSAAPSEEEEEEQILFSLVTSDRTQENGMNFCQGRFRLSIRKRFLSQRVVWPWNILPRAVVTAPSLREFKKRLDSAVRHMVRTLGVVLCRAGSWSLMMTWVPFNLDILWFYDSMNSSHWEVSFTVA